MGVLLTAASRRLFIRWLLCVALVLTAALPAAAQATEADESAPTDAFLAQLDGVLAEVQSDIDTLEAWIADPDIAVQEIDGRFVPVDLARLEELVPIAQTIFLAAPGLEKEAVDALLARSPEVKVLYQALTVLTGADIATLSSDAVSDLLRRALGQTSELKGATLGVRLDELRQEYADIETAMDAILGQGRISWGFSGSWTSTFGDSLELQQEGSVVTGSYDYDGGRVVFDVMRTHTLDGVWIEDSSDRECETARDGSMHWGRLVLQFDEFFSSYSGQWSYCDDEPNAGWSGTRITD